MMLPRLIRRLFPKFGPQSANVADLGAATSDRYGCWTIERRVILGGHKVGLCFITGARPPEQAEIAMYREVAAKWPAVWSTIIEKLQRDLEDDGPKGEKKNFLTMCVR